MNTDDRILEAIAAGTLAELEQQLDWEDNQ